MIIDRTAYDAMISHMRQAAPLEGVGLLAGPKPGCPLDTNGDGDCGRRGCPNCGVWYESHRAGSRWVPLVNTAEFPGVRYEVDPIDLVGAWEVLDETGYRPWIVVHSHVRTSAAPSELDIRYAVDQSLLHLVVSLAGPEPVAVLWHLDPTVSGVARCSRVRYQVVDLGFQHNEVTDLTHDVSGPTV